MHRNPRVEFEAEEIDVIVAIGLKSGYILLLFFVKGASLRYQNHVIA